MESNNPPSKTTTNEYKQANTTKPKPTSTPGTHATNQTKPTNKPNDTTGKTTMEPNNPPPTMEQSHSTQIENEIKRDNTVNNVNNVNRINEKENGTNTPKRKRKIRRSLKNKVHYKNFGIYYNNIRGIKSKIETLKEIIQDKQSTIICIAETHLSETDDIKIEGYEIYRNDRNNKGGGVLIAII